MQGSKQMGHSDTSSRNFLRDARTEDNVNSMMRRIEDVYCLCFGWMDDCWNDTTVYLTSRIIVIDHLLIENN